MRNLRKKGELSCRTRSTKQTHHLELLWEDQITAKRSVERREVSLPPQVGNSPIMQPTPNLKTLTPCQHSTRPTSLIRRMCGLQQWTGAFNASSWTCYKCTRGKIVNDPESLDNCIPHLQDIWMLIACCVKVFQDLVCPQRNLSWIYG